MMLEYITGPAIGAVIGYCTNYIAVKMLFYPRKEIRVWGHKLPFTPGAIPKGKDRLAKAIGSVVAGTLLTGEDVKKRLLHPEMEEMAVGKLMEVLSKDLESLMKTIVDSEEEYDGLKDKLAEGLTEKIVESVQDLDLETGLMREGTRIIKEKTDGTMLALFVTDGLIASILQPFGQEFVRYIEENGSEFIGPKMKEQVEALEKESVTDLLCKMEISGEMLRERIVSLYRGMVEQAVDTMMKTMDIGGIIEEKISGMAVEELEKLVLTVMKKELDVIVNLGAFIGAALGAINIFL